MNQSSSAAVAPDLAAAIKRSRPALQRYVRALLGADEARCAEIVAGVVDHLTEAPGEGDLVEGIYAVVRRRALGNLTRDAQAVGPAPEAPASAGGDDEAESTTVLRLIDRLTLKQQEVTRLVLQHGFDSPAAGRIVGLTPAGVAAVLEQAVARIGRVLRRREGAEMDGGDDPDDPALTSYVLEAMPAAERAGFDHRLANSPNLRAAVERRRDAVAAIRDALAVEHGARPSRRRRRAGKKSSRRTWWIGATAVLLLAAVAGWRFRSSRVEPESAAALAPAKTGAVATQAEVHARRVEDVPDEGLRRGWGGAASGGMAASGPIAGRTRVVLPGPAGGGDSHGRSERAAVVEPAAGQASWPVSPGEIRPGARDPAAQARGKVGDTAAEPAAEPHAEASSMETEPATREGKPTRPSPMPSSAKASAGDARSGPAKTPPPLPQSPSPRAEGARRPSAGPSPVSNIRDAQPGLAPRFSRTLRAPTKRGGGALSPETSEAAPVSLEVAVVRSPLEPAEAVAAVTVRAGESVAVTRPSALVVLVVDVSASMVGPTRLPLVREAVARLAERLPPEDRIAVVAYAEAARPVLPPTPVADRKAIQAALTDLQPHGLTNGDAGLRLGYEIAASARTAVGTCAVVLCTDGNFNLGETDPAVLTAQVEARRRDGLPLHVFGFGRADRNDPRLERLAVVGGGRSGYVNTRAEAGQLLITEVDGLLPVVAEEVGLRTEAAGVVSLAERRPDLRAGQMMVRAVPMAAGQAAAVVAEVRCRAPGTVAPAVVRAAWSGAARDWPEAAPEHRFAAGVVTLARVAEQTDRRLQAEALDRLAAWAAEAWPEDADGYRAELLALIERERLRRPAE